MEIGYISNQGLKIRGKQISIFVNPTTDQLKAPSDVMLFMQRVEHTSHDAKIVIDGPGEYEISGVKITGTRYTDDICYEILIDGIDILLSKTASLTKMKDAIREYQLAILFSEGSLSEGIATALNPSMFILYGENAAVNAKTLGQEALQPISKINITRDKLPTETQIVVLA